MTLVSLLRSSRHRQSSMAIAREIVSLGVIIILLNAYTIYNIAMMQHQPADLDH